MHSLLLTLLLVPTPQWLPTATWPTSAPFNFSSGPVWTAVQDGNAEYVPPSWLSTETYIGYDLEPLTVNCKALYEGLLPAGECHLFGRIVGGFYSEDDVHPSYFDVSDGYKKTVRIYPIAPLDITKGTFGRFRIFVEQKGRGDADEIVLMVGQ